MEHARHDRKGGAKQLEAIVSANPSLVIRAVEEGLYQVAYLESLGHRRRGGVFTGPYALCVLQGSTEEAGTPYSFSTISYWSFVSALSALPR